eukprot:179205_1
MTDINLNNNWILAYNGLEIYGDYGSIYSYHSDKYNIKYKSESFDVTNAFVYIHFNYKYISKDIINLIVQYYPATIQYEAYWMGRSIGSYPIKELYERRELNQRQNRRIGNNYHLSNNILPFGNYKFNSLNDLDGDVFKTSNNKLYCHYLYSGQHSWLGVTSLLMGHPEMGDHGLYNKYKCYLPYNNEDVRISDPDCSIGAKWVILNNGDIFKASIETACSRYNRIMHMQDKTYINFISDLKDYYEWNKTINYNIDKLTDNELLDFSDFIISQIIQISSTDKRCVFVLKNGYVFMIHEDETNNGEYKRKNIKFEKMRIFGIRRINKGCLMDDKLKVTGGRSRHKTLPPRLLLNVRNVKKCKLIEYSYSYGKGRRNRQTFFGNKLFYLTNHNEVFILGDISHNETTNTPKSLQYIDNNNDDKIIDIDSKREWYNGGLMMLTKNG